MPTHKGIKLSVISQWELQVHPEFAHPDSTQFTFRGANVNEGPLIDKIPNSEASESKADRVLGRQSTVAVYIPSVSGARFWIRYNIIEAAAAISPWYYFKLFMNGRHVTSWGTNSTTKPSGQIMRGLFDPSERWNYKDNGTVFKNNGTEIRPFFFTKEDVNRTAAEDGGLIEVQVFRARGRRRRIPKPEEFRSQDKWGIMMPTGGLLEKPQDAKFYDWHLADTKDKPFATFQFHYRSWESLILQQLVPPEHPRALLPASPSLLSLNGHPRESQEPPSEDDKKADVKIRVDEVEQEDEPRDSISSNASNTPWITSVFDDSPGHGAKNPDKPAALFSLTRTTSSYPLRFTNNIQVPISKFTEAALDGPSDGSPSPPRRWGDIHDRTLLVIPFRTTSLNQGQHLRSSSALSNAVSITPSLRSYFDRDTISPEPPIIEIATLMPVIASTFGLNTDPEKKVSSRSGSGSTDEPYVDAPSEQSTTPPTRTPSKGPLGGVFNLSLSNITMRKHRSCSSPAKHLSPVKQSPVLPSESSQLPDEDNKDVDSDAEPSTADLDNNMTTLSLTESEWMCRTPSPVRNDPESDRGEKLWGPGVEKHSFSRNSLDGSVLRKKTCDVGVRDSGEIEEDGVMGRGVGADCEVKMRSGNWI